MNLHRHELKVLIDRRNHPYNKPIYQIKNIGACWTWALILHWPSMLILQRLKCLTGSEQTRNSIRSLGWQAGYTTMNYNSMASSELRVDILHTITKKTVILMGSQSINQSIITNRSCGSNVIDRFRVGSASWCTQNLPHIITFSISHFHTSFHLLFVTCML